MQCDEDFQDAREYNNNENYFDVFDTKHINVHDNSQFANANLNENTNDNAIYNFSNNYELYYFDDEYHNEFNFQRLNVNNYYQRVSTESFFDRSTLEIGNSNLLHKSHRICIHNR